MVPPQTEPQHLTPAPQYSTHLSIALARSMRSANVMCPQAPVSLSALRHLLMSGSRPKKRSASSLPAISLQSPQVSGSTNIWPLIGLQLLKFVQHHPKHKPTIET